MGPVGKRTGRCTFFFFFRQKNFASLASILKLSIKEGDGDLFVGHAYSPEGALSTETALWGHAVGLPDAGMRRSHVALASLQVH